MLACNDETIARVVPRKRQQQRQSNTRKRRWTALEDSILRQRVEAFGTSSWVAIAKEIPDRTAKQCRERWSNNLRPGLNIEWTDEDDIRLFQFITRNGRDWKGMTSVLPGKTANSLKNRFSSLVRRLEKEKSSEEISMPARLVAAIEAFLEREAADMKASEFPLSIEALLNKPC